MIETHSLGNVASTSRKSTTFKMAGRKNCIGVLRCTVHWCETCLPRWLVPAFSIFALVFATFYYLIDWKLTLIDSLLRAAGLFLFDSQFASAPVSANKCVFWYPIFDALRVLMPIQTFVMLFNTLWPKFRNALDAAAIHSARGHMVFLGGGERAWHLAKAIERELALSPKQMPMMVVVDFHPDPSGYAKMKKRYGSAMVLVGGNYEQEQVLVRANVTEAGRVYITGSDDMSNAMANEITHGLTKPRVGLSAFERSIRVSVPDVRLHLSTSTNKTIDEATINVFDVRLSAARLMLMCHPPFRMTESGVLTIGRPIVLVGTDVFNERLLCELSGIWKEEWDREQRFLIVHPTKYLFMDPYDFETLKVTVIGKSATLWVNALRQRFTALNDVSIDLNCIDVEPRFLTKSILGDEIVNDAFVSFSIEGEAYVVDTLTQLYTCLDRGTVVCSIWGLNPVEVIAKELDKTPKPVSVHSFSMVANDPSHAVLDGSQWYLAARYLHQEVYGEPFETFNLHKNLVAVKRFTSILASCNCRLSQGFSLQQSLTTLDIAGIKDRISRLEHIRWCRLAISDGKEYGPHHTDNFRPALRLWEDLETEGLTASGYSARLQTIEQCTGKDGFPRILADLGLVITNQGQDDN